MWAKQLEDGTVSIGETITGPGWTLDADSLDGVDGWQRYDTLQAAWSALLPDYSIDTMRQDIATVTEAVAALTGGG